MATAGIGGLRRRPGHPGPRPWPAARLPQPQLGARRRRPRAGALRETHVEFPNHRGELLVGTLVDPEPAAAAAAAAAQQRQQQEQEQEQEQEQQQQPPVVILAHGYMSSRHSELLVRLSTALARSCGLASLRFDFSGNGDSGGEFRYGQYRSEAEELRCAKEHLERRLGRRVGGMVGHSKGATDVLLYASRYDDLPCAVNLAARFDLRTGVTERLGGRVLRELEERGEVEMRGRSNKGLFSWTLRKEDLDDRLGTDMAAACGAIVRTPVLTVHGDADADVPVAEARKIAAAVKAPHELAVLEGADHCFTSGAATYELAAAVLPFLERHAAAAASAQGVE